MNSVKIKSYAKINLTLEIVGEAGGYHLLDSLVASIDLFDEIRLKKRKDGLCFVTMKGLGSESIPPERNNALKAAEAFVQAFGTSGADITVFRNIPVGAGLGSSSADTAGVLNGMAKLYGVEKERLYPLAERLGSDTRYMMDGGFAIMQGRGEIVKPIACNETLHFLLICPKTSVSTPACFQEYDRVEKLEKLEKSAQNPLESYGKQTQNAVAALTGGDINGLGRYLTNDLFAPATRLSKDVLEAHGQAVSFSPTGAVMTGSGSAVLAMFETEEFCRYAQSRYRGKARTYVVKTVLPTKKGWKNPFRLTD